MKATAAQQLALYRQMLLIRRMEEQLKKDADAGLLPGGVHLYIGQEAVAAGVCAHLEDEDWIASTHRGHGHFLAKGGDPGAMLAEIHGHGNGICGGMGGSMHVADFARGIIGANGIVGAGLAIATGAAFAAELDGKGRVGVCFFGDGAANQGVLMETLNISALWRLPMIFVCEHNAWSEFSPSATVTAGEVLDRARAFDIPATKVDGNDALAVWAAAAAAVARARRGEGPSFIEAGTYRIYGHNENEKLWLSTEYRTQEEVDEWRKKDPIDRLGAHLLEHDLGTEADMERIEEEIRQTVAAAAAFARAGSPPDPEAVRELMFVGQAP